MARSLLSLCLLLLSGLLMAQGVGINNPTPHASALLDLTSTDKGLLVPRMTTAQRDGIPLPATSLLVYNTTNARFEFFNGSAWVPLVVSSGTLDQAYDFDGAGAGRTITADAGAVRVDGTDGLQVTGTLNSGATLDLAGSGVRMFFYPRKAAFRAGSVTGTQWDDAQIGDHSSAWGRHGLASGEFSTAWGFRTQSTNQYSTAWGVFTESTGQQSTAWGRQSRASGTSATAWGGSLAVGAYSTSWGFGTTFGQFSTAWGIRTIARSYGETVFGLGPTDYSPSTNGLGQFRPANATDRLLVVGNAIDANNNDVVDDTERSNAFLILKNGNTAIGNIAPTTKLDVDGQVRIRGGNPAAGRVLMGDATGLATWVDPSTTASGTLDQAYDFGGPGAGRTIVADAGAVTIAGNDGVVSTGTLGNGAVAPSGIGVRLVWNPRKAAFRAGSANATGWDDAQIGTHSAAFGERTTASGTSAMAWGFVTSASFPSSTAWGSGTIASGQQATAWGLETTASSNNSTAWGHVTTSTSENSTAWGSSTSASNLNATAWGNGSQASGPASTAWGIGTRAPSFAETTLGHFSSTYTPLSMLGINANDRLFTIGNGLNDSDRSNAFLILKNGNTAIGNANPNTRLDVVAGTTGATSRVLTVRSNFSTNNTGTGIALINSTSNTSNVGSEIISVTTNASTGLSDLRFHVHGGGGTNGALDERMRIQGNGNVGIGTNTPARRLHVATGVSGATSNANTALLVEGETATYQHFLTPSTAESGIIYGTEVGSIRGGLFFNNTNATDGIQFRTGGNATRMTLTSGGNLGIGTNTPARRLHVATGVSGATSAANTALVVEGAGAAYQHFLTPSANESGLLYGTEVGSIRGGIIFNNTSVSDGIQFRTGGNTTRMSITDAGLVGIGTTAPTTRLQVNGAVTVTPPAVVTANATVFAYDAGDRSYVRMSSNNTPLNRIVALSDGLSTGQVLVVECGATGSNGIRFQDTSNMNVSGIRDLQAEDTITFIWNGTKWLEISYANN